MSERQPDGEWGPPVNLGNTINTRYNEECPYISADGKTLYFSSYGHYNMGGYDVFYSRKNEDGTWAKPVNLGYPINTTDDDLYFQPYNNGNSAYYSVYSPSGIGRHDIYYMNIYSADNPRLYTISGNLRTEDGRIDSSRMAIYVIDSDSGDTLIYTHPEDDGAFAFQLKQGIYELHFKGDGYEDLIRPLEITMASNKRGIPLQDNIELALFEEEEVTKEVEVFEGKDSQIKLKESQLDVVAGLPLAIPLTAPKGSTIVVRTYQDNILISTDTIVTEKRKSDLQIVPLAGSSVVELEMSDKKGNIHRNTVTVKGLEPELEALEESMDQEAATREIMEQEAATGEIMDQEAAGVETISETQAAKAGLILLAESVAGGDAELLRLKLLESADEPLKGYLEQLDLEAEGIQNSQDLLDHLEKEAEVQGFTIDEIREALQASQEKPLEVHRLYEDLLQSSGGMVREILESIDLQEEDIHTEEQLLNLLSRELEKNGVSKKEINKILSELFGAQYQGSEKAKSKTNWVPLAIIIVSGAGLIWLIIAWWRRRKKEEK
jgi:hypothetical protein